MQSELIEFNSEKDHVHLSYSVTNFVGKIKGKISYFMRKEFWPEIKNKLWGKHFWSPSYCVVSCGGAPLEIVKKCIEDQNRPTDSRGVKKSKAIAANSQLKQARLRR